MLKHKVKKYRDYINGVNDGTTEMHDALIRMGELAISVRQLGIIPKVDLNIGGAIWCDVIMAIVDAESDNDPAIEVEAQKYITHYEAIRARMLNQIH